VVVPFWPGFDAAASAQAQYAFSPSSGSVGSRITVTGSVPLEDRTSVSQQARLHLERRQDGGVLSLSVRPSSLHVDAAGRLKADFVVPRAGRYLYGTPDAGTHPAGPGRYTVSFPCHACPIGAFVVSSPALPGTGFPTGPALWAGGLLLASGGTLVLSAAARRRRPS
jgi:hypothetical protein